MCVCVCGKRIQGEANTERYIEFHVQDNLALAKLSMLVEKADFVYDNSACVGLDPPRAIGNGPPYCVASLQPRVNAG